MRMLFVVFAGVMLFGIQVPNAQSLPDLTRPLYFEVVGVASDDVLNVRSEPTADSEIVGALEHNASPVEAAFVQNGWAFVSIVEGVGWVSATYLKMISLKKVGTSALQSGLVCVGTEPFWSLDIADTNAPFLRLGEPDQLLTIDVADGVAGMSQAYNFMVLRDATTTVSATVSDQLCSDHMSERLYPRRIDMVVMNSDKTYGLTGCCSMPLN